LRAGDLEATYLPDCGMQAASLRHRGEELLHAVTGDADAGAVGRGIPLLYPWANRLARPRYAFGGKPVVLDPSWPWLQCDERGLVNHGMRSEYLPWRVAAARPDCLVAALDWTGAEMQAVFPFRHRLVMTASLAADALTVTTAVAAEELLPVAFGFHPNLRVPGVPRSEWRLDLPSRQRLQLDETRIPSGHSVPEPALDTALASLTLDAAYAVAPGARLSLRGGGRRLSIEMLHNFGYAQVYVPSAEPFVAIEPMTAPANALVSGQGLPIASPAQDFSATFRLRIDAS
jgi:galactose mutarotase-like enzyme